MTKTTLCPVFVPEVINDNGIHCALAVRQNILRPGNWARKTSKGKKGRYIGITAEGTMHLSYPRPGSGETAVQQAKRFSRALKHFRAAS